MKLFRKLFNKTDTILIRNNIIELWANRRSRFYIIFVPVLIAILIPVLYLLIALLTSEKAQAELAELGLMPMDPSIEPEYEQSFLSEAYALIRRGGSAAFKNAFGGRREED